ncbi:transglutaminase-like cysteine peptidase [Ahrensia sp. 13_GOM-1096m]|uniref:transglutaminase-like cysteine peptidase n=1 Tax=Ahrensia sp. 13_GOM-1096m TaxID=1380380 RepID=UPI000478DAF4|nr:transglutaminase-like cysteine peptidase [Ahrensia sp. 13_GOM-1096m]
MRLTKIKVGLCATAISMVALSAVVANASSMITGKLTSQPIGHYEFCLAYSEECQQDRKASLKPVHLTRELWKNIVNINSAINMVIEPRSDLEIYGREEVWAYPDIAGDCEDYVLLKRKMLIKQGISPSALLITVVRKPDGEGHAVLTVRTDRGDFVLDNLNSQVRVWDQTPYEYLKRQSERHAGHWVTIESPDMTVVGSVKKSD